MMRALVLFACLTQTFATCATELKHWSTVCKINAVETWVASHKEKMDALLPKSKNPSIEEYIPVFEFLVKGDSADDDAPGCALCSGDCATSTQSAEACIESGGAPAGLRVMRFCRIAHTPQGAKIMKDNCAIATV